MGFPTLLVLATVCHISSPQSVQSQINRYGPVIVLQIQGDSTYEMGKSYGRALANELRTSLNILRSFFKGTYYDMLQGANEFQKRYTEEWNRFLIGMAEGSGLSYNDCKILNAMETLHPVESKSVSSGESSLNFACAFAYIPGNFTASGSSMIARNYDYPPPFDKIARNLIVTIMRQPGKIPVAIIGMPGQIYCPTCINAQGLFLELNNGAPSGGGADQSIKPSMLINMLDYLRSSESIDQLKSKLINSRSDYSLIVNSASKAAGISFEYSTRNSSVMSIDFGNQNFVSTNYFLNPVWNLPPPVDKDTFIGVTRRHNLMELLNAKQDLTFDQLKDIMDLPLVHGGAKWALTIYQIIFDYGTGIMSLKVPSASDKWFDFDLHGVLL